MFCTRFENAPLITPASSPSIGENINGPTLMRVPHFVQNPLGKYYLYFAHHNGKSIRMAYANSPAGPFTVYEPGALQLEDVERPGGFFGHIASPDIYVEEKEERIYLFFHGLYPSAFGQRTGVAVSADGIHFSLVRPDEIGSFYLRVFRGTGAITAFPKMATPRGCFPFPIPSQVYSIHWAKSSPICATVPSGWKAINSICFIPWWAMHRNAFWLPA